MGSVDENKVRQMLDEVAAKWESKFFLEKQKWERIAEENRLIKEEREADKAKMQALRDELEREKRGRADAIKAATGAATRQHDEAEKHIAALRRHVEEKARSTMSPIPMDRSEKLRFKEANNAKPKKSFEGAEKKYFKNSRLTCIHGQMHCSKE